MLCLATGQIGMSSKGSFLLRRSLTAICLLIPLGASANPVMLDPVSLLAFYIVAFWAFVVEAGVVALPFARREGGIDQRRIGIPGRGSVPLAFNGLRPPIRRFALCSLRRCCRTGQLRVTTPETTGLLSYDPKAAF